MCSLSKEIISIEKFGKQCIVLIFSGCLVNLLLRASNKKEHLLTILCHWLWTRYLLQYRIHGQSQTKVALRAVRCSRHLKSKLKSLFSHSLQSNETVSLVTSALSEKAETQSQSRTVLKVSLMDGAAETNRNISTGKCCAYLTPAVRPQPTVPKADGRHFREWRRGEREGRERWRDVEIQMNSFIALLLLIRRASGLQGERQKASLQM